MEDGRRVTTARSGFSLGSKSKYFSPDRIKPLPVLEEEGAFLDLDGAGELQATGSKRPVSKKRNVSEVSWPSKPPSKKKKPSRPYAPPETYAHLAHLPDYLKANLDGKLGSDPWEPNLTNVFCSCVLWYKVSHRSYTSVVVHPQRPVQPCSHPQTDTTMLTRRTTSGNV